MAGKHLAEPNPAARARRRAERMAAGIPRARHRAPSQVEVDRAAQLRMADAVEHWFWNDMGDDRAATA